MTEQSAVAGRYRLDGGAASYWKFQEPIGRRTATFDQWKISPYVHAEDRLVEFGCGGGFLLDATAARTKMGIEANPLARAAATGRGLDVRASLDDVETGKTDVVWSHHALEHTLDPWQVLTSTRRVLAPGGRLVLWLPIDDWRAQRRATEPDVNGHLWTWTPLLVQNLLREVGYHCVDAKVVTHAWPRAARLMHVSPWLWQRSGWVASAVRRDRQLLVLAS